MVPNGMWYILECSARKQFYRKKNFLTSHFLCYSSIRQQFKNAVIFKWLQVTEFIKVIVLRQIVSHILQAGFLGVFVDSIPIYPNGYCHVNWQ